jgi:hypothetical protein
MVELNVLGYSGREPAPDHLGMIWPALEMVGEMTIGDVRARVASGTAQIWVVQEDGIDLAVALTEMVDYPRLSALRVIAIGGADMASWQGELYDSMVRFCQQEKLRRIEMVCRPGLEKIMKPLGFEKKLICMLKEVPDGKGSRCN